MKAECLLCVLNEARPGYSAHLIPIDCVPMEGTYTVRFHPFYTTFKKHKPRKLKTKS